MFAKVMGNIRKWNASGIFLLSALAILVYLPTFSWMVQRWTAADTYYNHGFLVPFICGYIIWQKREELRRARIHPVQSGWAFFIAGILIHIVSILWQVYFSSGFSLLFVLTGLVLLFLGKEFLATLLFPLLYLVFMIPLPVVVIANLTFRLKTFAAQTAVMLVTGLGVPAIRDGSIIKTEHSSLLVGDPCSGLRSLIALVALGTIMAYFRKLPRLNKVVLAFSSLPIAIFSNIIRIAALTFVSEVYGYKYATGIFHDITGVLVYIFAFFGLSLVAKMLE